MELAIFNDPLNEVEADIDVFSPGMVLMIFGKCNSGLIV